MSSMPQGFALDNALLPLTVGWNHSFAPAACFKETFCFDTASRSESSGSGLSLFSVDMFLSVAL
jgi:hypothetical protein